MVSMENDRYPIEITRVIDGDGFLAKALDGSNRVRYACTPLTRPKAVRNMAKGLQITYGKW